MITLVCAVHINRYEKDSQKCYSTEVKVEEIHFSGGKKKQTHFLKNQEVIEMDTTIIAISNQKGEVYKTITAYNIRAALSLKHDKKVLLVNAVS